MLGEKYELLFCVHVICVHDIVCPLCYDLSKEGDLSPKTGGRLP